jgi:D-alanyl-D-alanine carboxypeptidase/D-alanyl-D-alanine-endopeptidase (penicillin-binding protein 4)
MFTVIFLGITACSPLKKSLKNLDENTVFANSFTGFVLFDPENNEVLFDHQGSKYFTPASNTKLFTFYAANQILGDSIPAVEYTARGDTIWLWGTGDPSFLNPDLPGSKVFDFLKGKHVYLVRDHFSEPAYGPGWAWDDFNYGYQRAKASFPIYGNAVHLSWDSLTGTQVIWPSIFNDSISFEEESTARNPGTNQFSVDRKWDKNDTLAIPLWPKEQVFAKLWSDTLASSVQWIDYIAPSETTTMYSIPSDSAYQQLLQVSDNFVAEQLILLCSWKLFGELNSSRTLAHLSDSLLADLPQAPIWQDGSGLSRYNLFTPMSMVSLLKKIYQEVGEERIFEIFPAGGQSGTIEEYYHADPPYIYAKTGTLRNNHALSGYLIAKSGKRLVFSFMHNHYATGSYPIKKEMEKLLWQVHLKY